VSVFGVKNGKYERGTLLQRALDPFSGAGRDENGTIILAVTDKDIAHEGIDSEELLRAEYANLNSKDDVWDVDGEDENQIRIDLLEELENGKTDFEIKNFEKNSQLTTWCLPRWQIRFRRRSQGCLQNQSSHLHRS